MPGHSRTTYWTSVDFDSEDDGDQSSNPKSQRIYMDPWDLDNYTFVRRSMNGEAGPAEQTSSFAGEPVSASFYYVPTKSYESDEEELAEAGPYRRQSVAVPPTVDLAPEYAGERRKSKTYFDEHHNEAPNAGYDMVHYERKPSRQHPDELYYQQQYGPEAYGPPQRTQAPGAPFAVGSRRRSVASHAEYVPPQMKHDRMSVQGRYPDSFDRYAYESIMADYSMDEWERNSDLPVKPPPENFHFSRYGHLKIDYSCSWNSLDRLIRNQ